MEWIKRMSLKKAFFVIIAGSLVLSVILSGLFYEICSAAIDHFALSRTAPAPVVPDAFDHPDYLISFVDEPELEVETYYIYHIEPWYSIISFLQLIVPILLVTGSLVFADIIFYRLKLKKPIMVLQSSAKRIREQDLDFEIRDYSADEMGQLCAAFELMRRTLQENNRELWRQAEERKRLNAAFSHDLRNPVTVLKGSAKMARQCAIRGTEKEVQLLDNLTRIETYTERIERYVEAMSSTGRLEQIPLEKIITDAQTLDRELENAIHLVAADAGKQLSFTGIETTRDVCVDKNVLFQIAENLVSNAIRFANQKISVSLSFTDDMLALEVTDDGSGFPAALLKNGIQPFQKGNEDTEHFGMGLYICDLLCRKHGGYMEIKNHEQGASVCAALKIS